MNAIANMKSTLIDVSSMWRMLKHVSRFRPHQPYNLARLLDERTTETPNGMALKYEDVRYTWRELDLRVNQYANYFQQQGVGRGDVVALLMDNRPEFVLTLLALNRIGAVGSLLNTNIKGVALTHALTVCRPVAVLVGTEHVPELAAVRGDLPPYLPYWVQGEVEAKLPEGFVLINEALVTRSTARPRVVTPNTSDIAAYIYTSGTTGLPKAALISNKRLLAAAYLFGGAIMNATPSDVVYVTLPLYHSSGIYAGLCSCLASGACLAIRRKFSASRFWDDVHELDASIVVYIGELCRYLLNTPESPKERGHRLRLATGNGLRPDIWPSFQERFGIPLVREFYGATEGNAPIVNFEGRPGMVGRLKPGHVVVACDPATGELRRNAAGFCEKVRPGDKGILLAKITRLLDFDGYLDKKATHTKVVTGVFSRGDRYFNSGDLLELHDGSWVSFADRIGDTFRWKGENVSTNEVADLLNKVPGILESNVYGVSVPGCEGRAGMAAIATEAGFDLGALGRYVVDQMPGYQRPYFVRILSDMRLTGTFKHQKVDYRDEAFDIGRVRDELYFLDGDRYVRIDDAVYAKLACGQLTPGQSLSEVGLSPAQPSA